MLQTRPSNGGDYSGFYSRHRSSSRRSHSSRRPKPEYERNVVSAFFALASAVLIAIAEAEPKWLKIVGGRCDGDYIGLYKVIAYKSAQDLEEFCYTSSMVTILRVTVGICCIAIVASMFSCLLDLCGTLNRVLKCLKNNAIANILTVMVCVATNGLVYWVTHILENSHIAQNSGKEAAIKVKFEVSFYLVAAAGASSVLATAFGLLYCQRRHRQRTASDEELSLELMYSMNHADSFSDIPPPAYSP